MTEKTKLFFEITRNRPPHTRTVTAVGVFTQSNEISGARVLDLGCGAGRDSVYLSSLGAIVTSVDADTSGIEPIAKDHANITVVQSRYDEFDFGDDVYDIVSSQWALSFNPSTTFNEMFRKLLKSVKPGGLLTCNIFGPNDEWNTNPSMTFLDREEIGLLLGDIEIIDFTETEEDSHIADGTPKHWHYFDLLLRKPLAQN